jgi:hypothetical protein
VEVALEDVAGGVDEERPVAGVADLAGGGDARR